MSRWRTWEDSHRFVKTTIVLENQGGELNQYA